MKIDINTISKQTATYSELANILAIDELHSSDLYLGTKVISSRDSKGIIHYYISKYRELFYKLSNESFFSISDIGDINYYYNREHWNIDQFRDYVDSRLTILESHLANEMPRENGSWLINPIRLSSINNKDKNYYDLLTYLANINKKCERIVNNTFKNMYDNVIKTDSFIISGDVSFEEVLEIVDQPIKRRR